MIPTHEVAARRARWQVTLHPGALWPDVELEPFLAAYREIVRVARAILADDAAQPHLKVLEAAVPGAFAGAAFLSGIGPLLGYWLEAGHLDTDPATANLLAARLADGRARADLLERRLGPVLDACDRVGLAPIVLKGMHTGRQYLPQAGTRPAADIDLLVRGRDLDQAAAALRAAGLVEVARTARPFRSEWAPPGPPPPIRTLIADHPAHPWSVDLHVGLGRRYFRGCCVELPERLFERPTSFAVAGREASGLGQPFLTAFLALHASHPIYQLRLLHLVELAIVMRRDGPSGVLSWSALADLLAETAADRFVFPAFELTERLVPGTVNPDVLGRMRGTATPAMWRVVRAMAEGGTFRVTRRSVDERLMWARGAGQWLGALAELPWPSDSRFTPAARLRTLSAYLRHLLAGRIALRSR